MSSTAGRVGDGGPATGSWTFAPLATPLARVVSGVAGAGAGTFALAAWLSLRWGMDGPVADLGRLRGTSLAALLSVLTCISELIAVRLRHRDAVEELTLLDPMVLLNVLLLPPVAGIGVSLAGLAAAYAIRRRALIKAAFNVGTYAMAASAAALFLRALAGPSGHFDVRLVLAMTTAAAGFVAVNICCIALLLAALGAGSVRQLILQDLRLSVFTVAATAAMSGTAVTIAVHTPVFLPFTALPAAAMTYAYRAAATEIEQRQRSAHVLVFSRVLAGTPGGEAVVHAFLRIARDGFFADEVLAVLNGHEVIRLGGDAGAGAAVPERTTADDVTRSLVASCADGAVLLDERLPPGWAQGLIAPLKADGAQVGAVAVGWSRHEGHRSQDLTMFASLASSLASALSRAEHLSRLVEETSKLRAVVDQSSDGILVLDGLGRVMVWNPALQVLSGVDEASALGRPLGELLDSRDPDGNCLDAFAAACRLLSPTGQQAVVEVQVVRPDGEVRSVRCAHSGSFDAHGLLVRDVVNVHDLTRERQVDRLKSDFIATVSHELRTPVTPIKGYAEMLRKRWDCMPEDKRTKALDVIVDRAGHLGRLVEDLLLASNISADGEPTRSVIKGTADLNSLVTRAAEDFVGARARLSVRSAPEPVLVDCDVTRAVQILTNLLGNALKYSPDDTTVEITVEAGAGLQDAAGLVRVRDHGRGIPADQLERIFEKFHRVEDPLVMSTGGSGLGLYIARHLARAMGGDLTVSSTLGHGSEFTLSLRPAAHRQQANDLIDRGSVRRQPFDGPATAPD